LSILVPGAVAEYVGDFQCERWGGGAGGKKKKEERKERGGQVARRNFPFPRWVNARRVSGKEGSSKKGKRGKRRRRPHGHWPGGCDPNGTQRGEKKKKKKGGKPAAPEFGRWSWSVLPHEEAERVFFPDFSPSAPLAAGWGGGGIPKEKKKETSCVSASGLVWGGGGEKKKGRGKKKRRISIACFLDLYRHRDHDGFSSGRRRGENNWEEKRKEGMGEHLMKLSKFLAPTVVTGVWLSEKSLGGGEGRGGKKKNGTLNVHFLPFVGGSRGGDCTKRKKREGTGRRACRSFKLIFIFCK